MEPIVTPGLVLKETRYKESDRIITILTPGLGVISASAQSSLRLKNKLFSACGLFCYSEFVLLPGRNMYTVREAESKNVFHGIASSIEGMSLAMYMAEMAAALSPTGEEAEKELRLLLNCLYMLSEKKADLRVIKAVFELRLMCLAGYEPDLSCCAQCGAAEPDEPWFSPRGGAVYCAHCRGASSSAVTPLLPETLAAMRHIVNADPKKIFSFTLGDAGRRQLAHVCEDYTATQLERGFASLDYWKKVKD